MNLILSFQEKHPRSRVSLDEWLGVIKKANWHNLIELRSTFNSADYVKGYTIFNIGGNNFRVIAIVNFKKSLVSVAKVMTHAEYDRWKP